MIVVFPTLIKKKSQWLLDVLCPYCNKIHRHGGGNGDDVILGSRVSHCLVNPRMYEITMKRTEPHSPLVFEDPKNTRLVE